MPRLECLTFRPHPIPGRLGLLLRRILGGHRRQLPVCGIVRHQIPHRHRKGPAPASRHHLRRLLPASAVAPSPSGGQSIPVCFQPRPVYWDVCRWVDHFRIGKVYYMDLRSHRLRDRSGARSEVTVEFPTGRLMAGPIPLYMSSRELRFRLPVPGRRPDVPVGTFPLGKPGPSWVRASLVALEGRPRL